MRQEGIGWTSFILRIWLIKRKTKSKSRLETTRHYPGPIEPVTSFLASGLTQKKIRLLTLVRMNINAWFRNKEGQEQALVIRIRHLDLETVFFIGLDIDFDFYLNDWWVSGSWFEMNSPASSERTTKRRGRAYSDSIVRFEEIDSIANFIPKDLGKFLFSYYVRGHSPCRKLPKSVLVLSWISPLFSLPWHRTDF